MHHQWERDGLVVTTDPARLDVGAIHAFLTGSYWAEGVPLETVDRSLRGSLCFGLLDGGAQVGFARAVTDRATYAYLADAYVLESHRGRGLGVWLMECIMSHPDLQGLRRWSLVTRDAHGLYRKLGFEVPAQPERYMEVVHADIYKKTG
jgi:GNAT superfamily N-acetyltransferase